MIVVDTGPLYAYVDRDDRYHEASLELLATHPGPLVVPVLTVTEASYLIATRLGADAEVHFLGDLASDRFVVEPVDQEDWLRIAELVHRYADLPLGTVDASVVAASERLGVEQVATTDRHDFTTVRPRHTERLEVFVG